MTVREVCALADQLREAEPGTPEHAASAIGWRTSPGTWSIRALWIMGLEQHAPPGFGPEPPMATVIEFPARTNPDGG
jgi:hypothetical protein